MLTQLWWTVHDSLWPVWVNNLNFFLSDPKKATEKAQFNATVGNLSEKYGLKDKDKEMAKAQQETAGDPDAGDLDATPEPTPGEKPKRKPRGKKDTNKGGAAIEMRSRREH